MKRLFFTVASMLLASTALAQTASMQSPAYTECTALAASLPEQALAKADTWLKIDNGVAAQHCRAMALFGMHRYAEAGDALVTARSTIAPDSVTLRSYVTRQAVQAYLNANSADKALAVLNAQITEIGDVRGDNANAAKHTSSLLLDRARLNATYGKLDASAKDLDHAVSLTPVNEEILLERASVFERIGDVQLARNDLDAVLTINPNNNVAKNARARLSGKPVLAAPPQPVASLPASAPVTIVAPAAAAATVVDTAVAPVTRNELPTAMFTPAAVATPFVAPTAAVEPAALPVTKAAKKAAKPAAKKIVQNAQPTLGAAETVPATVAAPIANVVQPVVNAATPAIALTPPALPLPAPNAVPAR